MKYERKNTPRVIWETKLGNITISAIEHGYRFGKCGLRLARCENGKVLQKYASYIPVDWLRDMLDMLDKPVTPKQLLLSFCDTIPAQVCRESGIGMKGEELKKTFLIAAINNEKALIRSTIQWGENKPRVLEAEIALDDLYNLAATMEQSYRAYQLCKGTASRRTKRNTSKGVDVFAA